MGVFFGMGGPAFASLECREGVPPKRAATGPTLRIVPGKVFSLRPGAGARLGGPTKWEMRFLSVDEDLRCPAPPPTSCAVDGAAVVRVRLTRARARREICFRISRHPEDPRISDRVFHEDGVRLELKALERNAEFQVTRE